MKEKNLVLAYLENVSSSVFSEFPKEITAMVAGRHGIYALYKGDRLYYVGLATNLHRRVNYHLRDKHAGKWDSFRLYLIRKSEHIKELESLILRIADPKGNSVKGRMPHAEKLNKRLNSEMKKRQDKIRTAMLNPFCKKKTAEKKVKRNGSAVRRKKENNIPALSGYVENSFLLRKTYKGKTYEAVVFADGTIQYGGKIYNSPSSAAMAVVNHPVNGWTFWSFKNKSSKWVTLDLLRKSNTRI
ncbi:MAG: hypothetical protein WC959_07260 [Kiritimatiellales bacterium]